MAAEDLVDLLPSILLVAILLGTTGFGWYVLKPRNYHSFRSVAILVLGDVGRSPRMMYHAQSFAENGFVTDIVGYKGADLTPALERLPRVQAQYLPDPPRILRYLPFVIAAPIKIIHQIISILLVLLVYIEKPPEFLVVQNPPSIPSLALVQLVGRIRGSKVIIDWHNLGYSILALKLGEKHLFIRISKWFEQTFGYSAYAHLFVTRAMHDYLVKEWDLQCVSPTYYFIVPNEDRGHKVVLHDRPPRHFHRSSAQEAHELFCKLEPLIFAQKSMRDFLPQHSPPYSTPFTHITSAKASLSPQVPTSPLIANRAVISPRGNSPMADALPNYTEIRSPTMRPDRPAILVSSTSWTPDEDFSILLEALGMYEARARELFARGKEGESSLPNLLAIVTGKGPMKKQYMEEVGKMQESWKWVRCISLWLEAEDYPVLLGSADLGVSLHSSSSGLDLPMKIVDMFGCGLPVCALSFKCLDELVKTGKNGKIFKDAPELAEQLEILFTGFPSSTNLTELSLSLANTAKRPSTPTNMHGTRRKGHQRDEEWVWSTWDENWGRVVRPLVLRDVNLSEAKTAL
ncbi:hypothetical protein FA13DRAFT_1808946 [Coprinellus micaceus]|uniref:Chitobiosyldiphosphodolichol beta-mannosyltransferase n=1 Tax=Coprinellus micaceus TaxID=71717 RepID=A0A4Y7TY89_COPMI|nr:hypothetical protein FA13DRAFT_1808946 [Coprinellus micaceus]